MFSANSEVSTKDAMIRSTRKVPRIETAPISSGIPAATTPLNTRSKSTASTGKAIISAFVRSLRV